MRFVSLVAVFIGLAAAAPAPVPTANPTKDDMIVVSTVAPSAEEKNSSTYWSAGNYSFSVCDKSSYVARKPAKTTKPADFNDCAALLSTFGSHNGTFSIPSAAEDESEYAPGDGHVNIVKSGSCAFSVRADKGVKVGDDDVVWIVRKAVLENSAGTNIVARGSVKCATTQDGGGEKGGLYWQVHGIGSTGY
ncbi:hypothetical protein FAVG1_03608 [Fusarium avenaceum]|nr:hypothetical protein FAVG1_03608 [Fusarium avenaceum]